VLIAKAMQCSRPNCSRHFCYRACGGSCCLLGFAGGNCNRFEFVRWWTRTALEHQTWQQKKWRCHFLAVKGLQQHVEWVLFGDAATTICLTSSGQGDLTLVPAT